MREFTTQFPENGFYAVTRYFKTENFSLLPGEAVAIQRMGNSRYIWILKTGERFGGWKNFMEVEHWGKLQKLSYDEVSKLTDGVTITEAAFVSSEILAEACKAITGSVDSLRMTLRDYRQKCRVFVKLPDGKEVTAQLRFENNENTRPIEDFVYLFPYGVFKTDAVQLLNVLKWEEAS